MADSYTAEILRENFTVHRDYVKVRKAAAARTGLDIRLPNVPEDISENIVKFIIRNRLGDETSRWVKNCKDKDATKGDLISRKEGRQECKCFTSSGPSSFGPDEPWDVIYFLDMRGWLEDHLILYRVPLKNTDPLWQGLVMDSRKGAHITFGDQCRQGKRPHKSWDSIRAQLPEEKVETVFEGKFEDIFARPPAVCASVPLCLTEEVQTNSEAFRSQLRSLLRIQRETGGAVLHPVLTGFGPGVPVFRLQKDAFHYVSPRDNDLVRILAELGTEFGKELSFKAFLPLHSQPTQMVLKQISW